MKEATDLTLTISNRVIAFEIQVGDEDLIDAIFNALTEYVKGGSSLNILQMYANAPSDSTRIVRKVVLKASQMLEWRDELKRLIAVLRIRV